MTVKSTSTINTDRIGLGVFDGLHLGHQKIAEKSTTLLTFSPHPDKILNKSSNLKRLTTLRELRYLYPNLLTCKFSKELAAMQADQFLNTIILPLNPKELIVGYDFGYGTKKSGNTQTLNTWCQANNILLHVIPEEKKGDHAVKSSLIRNLIQDNQFQKAITLLGHPYPMIGKVIKGEGRGKQLGFPTANLKFPEEKLIPAPGVYQGTVDIKDSHHNCLISIGNKPTFNQTLLQTEVHIPNFSQDLYNKNLKVNLTKKIRNQIKFDTKNDLISQIKIDLQSLPT